MDHVAKKRSGERGKPISKRLRPLFVFTGQNTKLMIKKERLKWHKGIVLPTNEK
jgi:hypothetical protein